MADNLKASGHAYGYLRFSLLATPRDSTDLTNTSNLNLWPDYVKDIPGLNSIGSDNDAEVMSTDGDNDDDADVMSTDGDNDDDADIMSTDGDVSAKKVSAGNRSAHGDVSATIKSSTSTMATRSSNNVAVKTEEKNGLIVLKGRASGALDFDQSRLVQAYQGAPELQAYQQVKWSLVLTNFGPRTIAYLSKERKGNYNS